MMEFLDKIYGYENFGIILFAVIMALVVLFLIILFFGKKDEKKREIERTQKLEKEALEGFAEVNPDATPLEVKEPTLTNVEEMVAPIIEENPVMQVAEPVEEIPSIAPMGSVVEPTAPVLEPIVEPSIAQVAPAREISPVVEESPVATVIEPVIQPEVKLEPVNIPMTEPVVTPIVNEEPKLDIEIPEFNFDELAASIANELEALENVNKVVEETKDPVEAPIVNRDVPVTPINEVVKPVVDAPKPTPGPVTFSSVYINKPVEPVAPVVEPVPVETVVEPVVAPQPTQINPNIELPKPAEMPILKENFNSNPVNNATPDFSQFEGESYNLK